MRISFVGVLGVIGIILFVSAFTPYWGEGITAYLVMFLGVVLILIRILFDIDVWIKNKRQKP